MLVTEFQEMEENDAKRRSDAKRGHRLVERDEDGLCSDSPRHSMLNEMGQTASFVKEARGKTRIDDCRRFKMRQTRLVERRGQLEETRRTGSFVVEPRDEPHGEKQRDDGGRRLEKRRATPLVDQEKMKLPSEEPRHSVSSERIDVQTLNKGVDARTSSRGQLGLDNDDDRHLPGRNVSERRTAYSTLSQTQEVQLAGYSPASQHPTRLKTHNEKYCSPQMAVNPFQREPLNGSCSQNNIEQKLHHNDIVKDGRSKSNVENKNEQTGRAMVLINQRRTRPPPEVPRHGASNERIDVETSNEEVDTRTSSRGLNGLENDDVHRLPAENVSK